MNSKTYKATMNLFAYIAAKCEKYTATVALKF